MRIYNMTEAEYMWWHTSSSSGVGWRIYFAKGFIVAIDSETVRPTAIKLKYNCNKINFIVGFFIADLHICTKSTRKQQ